VNLPQREKTTNNIIVFSWLLKQILINGYDVKNKVDSNWHLLVTRVNPKAMPQRFPLARHLLDPGIQWRIVDWQNFFSTQVENQRYWKTVECCPERRTCKREVPRKRALTLMNKSLAFSS